MLNTGTWNSSRTRSYWPTACRSRATSTPAIAPPSPTVVAPCVSFTPPAALRYAEGVKSWLEQHEKLQHLARCQLFFVGGAPRSGTTWLQALLDSHPEISCRGEGLFMKHLAAPLDALMKARREAIE